MKVEGVESWAVEVDHAGLGVGQWEGQAAETLYAVYVQATCAHNHVRLRFCRAHGCGRWETLCRAHVRGHVR